MSLPRSLSVLTNARLALPRNAREFSSFSGYVFVHSSADREQQDEFACGACGLRFNSQRRSVQARRGFEAFRQFMRGSAMLAKPKFGRKMKSV